jgi:WD40 repeat protein
MAVGLNSIRFWKCSSSSFIHGVTPDLSELKTNLNFLCSISGESGASFVGSDDGYIFLFNESKLSHTVKAHLGSVVSITLNRNSKSIYSGGTDGVIRVWNDALECLKEISIEHFTRSTNFGCKALAVSFDNNIFTVGTFGGELFEIDIRKNHLVSDSVCTRGHSQKLMGLAVHPQNDAFVTVGDDALLR